MKHFRKLLLVGTVAIVLLAAFGFVKQPDSPASANTVFSLQAPPFLSVARAEGSSIASVIGDEAGIAAYFDAATTIDLNNVRDVYRTIEAETADYIIGSVEVENYPESEDVHVYVHTDGWILAYYLAADPVGKIYDWRAYHDSGQTDLTTKLENTLIKVAGYAVVSYPGCTYYDFRYPNATHLMLIAEAGSGGADSFEINIPSSFSYYERSWSLGSNGTGFYCGDHDARWILNGQEYEHFRGCAWHTGQGTLTAGQLLPNTFHTVQVTYDYGDAWAGLVLVYRVP